jgi:hypothetical protein
MGYRILNVFYPAHFPSGSRIWILQRGRYTKYQAEYWADSIEQVKSVFRIRIDFLRIRIQVAHEKQFFFKYQLNVNFYWK